jgi:hypothetical protein
MMTAHQDFLTKFDDERKPLVEAMLDAINEECPNLTKIIKWNSPTFCDNGKDRMTIMLHKKGLVGLILHTGTKLKEDKKAPHLFHDHTGLLEWNSNIRATITFIDLTDFLSKRHLFKRAVKDWLDETRRL